MFFSGGGVELARIWVDFIPLPGVARCVVGKWSDCAVGAAIAVALVNIRGGSSIPNNPSAHVFH